MAGSLARAFLVFGLFLAGPLAVWGYWVPFFPPCGPYVPLACPLPAPPFEERLPAPAKKKDDGKKQPYFFQMHSLGGVYPGQGLMGPRVKVGFWNLTGRDVVVKIDGQPRRLEKDQGMTLQLNRVFAWQVDEREAKIENVPGEKSDYEIFLR